MLRKVFALLLILIWLAYSADRGYGDWMSEYPGYPDMKDRRILLLTNSCRMDPTGYRDEYLGNYDILLPADYPAVAPLYWQIDLNRVARVHSEDMAQNGMSHTSSDGTSFSDRVKSYYTKSGWIAENIAAGNNNAKATIWQWLMDLVDYKNKIPAGDNSGDDGHRKNIMNSNYKEMGAGYAYGPAEYNHFWTQDFGGGTPVYNNPISAAAHFIEGNESVFMATYKDPANKNPQQAILNIEGTTFTLINTLGNSTAGTYEVSIPSADSCRSYYVEFTDSEGNTWRHPDGGMLVTLGEGGCTEQYVDPESLPLIYKGKSLYNDFIIINHLNNEIVFQFSNNNKKGFAIYNVSGKKLLGGNIQGHKFRLNLKNISTGFYMISIVENSKLINIKKVFISN